MIKAINHLTTDLWFIGSGFTAVSLEDITQDLSKQEFESRIHGFISKSDNYPPAYSVQVLTGAKVVRDIYLNH